MKREFLQNIKVGDAALPKEIIDVIMDENGRDIEAVKAKFADYDTIKTQLEEAKTTIQSFKDQGQDIEAARQKAAEWENKYNQAIADHEAEKAEREFMADIVDEITRRRGRNKDAIIGALGKDQMDALRSSKNRKDDIKAAFDKFQPDNSYLFDGEQTPPPYSPGAGSQNMGGKVSGVEAAFAKLNPGLKLD
ncbi:phage scaffolding protein [Butyricicoccus pullicaecorum]|uniref:Phage minor structural protein GP20 n=1 Tax=Butyricicoccus pullicaecorum TaxID=501571 RepID=A0A1Y4LTX0_9FIRM|nr:phage scaffolding protein [Butyricicoccus pullicaecorum]OUP59069.1 hypothetical protein B5F15_06285 [Butyricicoccus pullicaecorum]